jgi:hypothetical protein
MAMDHTDRDQAPAQTPAETERQEAQRRALAGHTPAEPGMPGPMGPAVTTEAVGDPDASSEQSAVEGGAAAGAVAGAVVGGPVGMAVGAVLGGAAGAAAGPEEPVAQPGDRRVDPRADREAAYEATTRSSPVATPKLTHDPLTEEHAVDIPVVDALTGHGEADAERGGRTPRRGR